MLVLKNAIHRYYNPIVSLRRRIMDQTFLLSSLISCIPPLDTGSHKGQAGRIGIIGGSLEYTGAPYFAGISALKTGADLVHVFCASSAAAVIKSYSPELIVHPLLDRPNATNEIKPWLDRLHVLVIGPGLGRDRDTFTVVSELIGETKEKGIPLVIDADGLFLITENPSLIRDYPAPGVILTPNKIEFERLQARIKGENENIDFKQLGGNITVLRKGASDEVYSASSKMHWSSNIGGSARRCGGQGDLLSGSIATFLNWCLSNKEKIKTTQDVEKHVASASIACYGASRMIRLCNEKAFKHKGRSMLASDMIEYIHESFEELFGQ